MSVRVEFKFEFEFKLVECGLKRKEERRKEPNLNPAQTPTGPISIQQPNTYLKPNPKLHADPISPANHGPEPFSPGPAATSLPHPGVGPAQRANRPRVARGPAASRSPGRLPRLSSASPARRSPEADSSGPPDRAPFPTRRPTAQSPSARTPSRWQAGPAVHRGPCARHPAEHSALPQ